MGSIEGAYIGISRYLINHPHGLALFPGWFPLWYGGIPLQNTYPPLLHILVAVNAELLHCSAALSHHQVSGLFYCLGPVAVFLLGFTLSKDWKPALAAGLLFSLASPSAFLMRSVHGDLGSVQLPRRLQTLVTYGEGPHVMSITLLIFALIALHIAAQRRSWPSIAAPSIAFAAVASTNWLGAFALALAVLCYLLAAPRSLPIALIAGVLGYGLVMPWLPPSTIMAVQRNAQYTVGQYPLGRTQAIYGLLLLAAVFALRWLLTRAGASLSVRFSSYFLLVTAAIALPGDWFHVYLMPQPERYHLEMELAIVLLLAFGLAPLFRGVQGKQRAGLLLMVLVSGVVEFRHYRHYARTTLRPVEIRQTVEYQTGTWLQSHMPGKRVFAFGSVGFWLNAFSDSPEVSGGFDQGLVNREIPVMTYGIPFMKGDGPVAAMWLRLLGAHAVSVTGVNGRDAYKDWKDPEKFDGVLPELWRDGGDVIYQVPAPSDSLMHVIPQEAVMWKSPVNIVDVEQARVLDAALSDPASDLQESGTVRPGQDFYIQISYHPGWHALVNSAPRPIRSDGMGFMVVDPQCNGKCDLQMVYDGGLEMKIANYVRGAAILVILMLLFVPAVQRALSRPPRPSGADAPGRAAA